MGFRAALDRVLTVTLTRASAEVMEGLRPWVDLVAELGPTPKTGPLHHDLLWPADNVGLNAFDHRSDRVMPVARRWTRDVLGEQAASELAALENHVPADTSWHAGAAHDRIRGWRLKLWAHGPKMNELALAFGVPGEWSHLGIDLRDGGLERARGYRRIDEAHPDWGASASWVDVAVENVSHLVVAELRRWPDPGAKRSFDTIFSPEATLDDLFMEHGRVAPLGRFATPPSEALRELEAAVRREGMCLRPAAFEIDVYPGEPARSDLLLTIGEP